MTGFPIARPIAAPITDSISRSEGVFHNRSFALWDGTDDYVSIPAVTASGDWDLEFKFATITAPTDRVVLLANTVNNNNSIVFDITTTEIRAYAFNGTTFAGLMNVSRTPYIDGALHTMRITYNDATNTGTLFADGSQVGTVSWNLSGNESVAIIGREGSGARYFNGIISDVDFVSGWSGGNPLYRLDDSDNTAVDSRGTNGNGTYNNFEGDFSDRHRYILDSGQWNQTIPTNSNLPDPLEIA